MHMQAKITTFSGLGKYTCARARRKNLTNKDVHIWRDRGVMCERENVHAYGRRKTSRLASAPVKIKFSGEVPGKNCISGDPRSKVQHSRSFTNAIILMFFHCSPVENGQNRSPVRNFMPAGSLGRDVENDS